MLERDVVVVGAGGAGIASALALRDQGLRPLVLDRAETVASAWRGRYDRLRLNTCRPFSHLPDRPYPRGTPMFPSRDEMVAHIERHAGEDGVELRLGTEVGRLARDERAWAVDTAAGPIAAAQVVVATGYENVPRIPDWEGRTSFEGRLLHSSEYRNPEPFRGDRVLVVGAGSSGMEIAQDLAEGGAARVWLAVRTPPNILLREGPGGMPGDMLGVALMRFPTRVGDAVARLARRDLGDLDGHGLPVPPEGVFSRLRRLGATPSIVDRAAIEAIVAGRIEVVGGVESLDAGGVALAGGGRVEPDAVVCATGFERGLEPLVGHLGVLGERGVPRAVGSEPPAPGLRFVGYVPRPGGIGYMAGEAKGAARAIARELASARG